MISHRRRVTSTPVSRTTSTTEPIAAAMLAAQRNHCVTGKDAQESGESASRANGGQGKASPRAGELPRGGSPPPPPPPPPFPQNPAAPPHGAPPRARYKKSAGRRAA